ncbi:MAG: Lrp/AsnC family transcriptional regulator [Hyphomonadaceae bacterium]
MDAIDKALLDLLTADASRPLKALAGEVGLSVSTVRERIARLQGAGIIKRFTIERDADAHGVRALLSLRLRQTPDPAVVAALLQRPDVLRCYSLAGPVDLQLELTGDTIAALNEARDAIARLEGVAEVETAFVLKRDKGG